MNLTSRAQRELDSYLDEVRRLLGARRDVDATEVVAGIREHVETELSMRPADQATAEDVAEVLERLGAPGSLAGEDSGKLSAHPSPGQAPTAISPLLGPPALVVWQIVVVCAAVVLLFAPAVVVWGQSQIGGVLEGPLTARLDIDGATRPAAYWWAVLALACMVTGIWWLLLGLLTHWHGHALRRALGAAHWIVPLRSSRVLLIAGVVLGLASFVGGLF